MSPYSRSRYDRSVKRYWVEYNERRVVQPMSYWVHREADGRPWYQAQKFDPPFRRVPGRGWPAYHVEVGRFTFRFASLHELDECIRVLGSRLLPQARRLSESRGHCDGRGNTHWLMTLPSEVRRWRYREKAVPFLREARDHFAQEER